MPRITLKGFTGMKIIYRLAVPVVFAAAIVMLMVWEVPYTIRSKGMVKPSREWGLYKSSDGTLSNVLEDHRSGSISHYKVMEFQRGDIMAFQFNDHLIKTNEVKAGDTIAWVSSHELDLRMVEKSGDLAYQQALLQVYLSGDRPEAIRVAMEQAELAKQELGTQERLTARARHLYEQDLISEQEYELAVNDLKVRQHALDIARSSVASLQAGEKEEQIGLARARISALENQIDQLRSHLEGMNILSPISGRLMRQHVVDEGGNNEVIRVADLSAIMVFAPVHVRESHLLQQGQPVSIRAEGSRKEISGMLIGVDNSVQWINRRPSVFASILVDPETDHGLLPNMVVEAHIRTDTVKLKDYLLRVSRVVYEN